MHDALLKSGLQAGGDTGGEPLWGLALANELRSPAKTLFGLRWRRLSLSV